LKSVFTAENAENAEKTGISLKDFLSASSALSAVNALRTPSIPRRKRAIGCC